MGALKKEVKAKRINRIKDYIMIGRSNPAERLKELEKIYNKKNPFPWMSQSTDLSKEKNFFETTVTEYQSAGNLNWD